MERFVCYTNLDDEGVKSEILVISSSFIFSYNLILSIAKILPVFYGIEE